MLDRDARLVRKTLLDLSKVKTLPDNIFKLPGAAASLVDADIAAARYQATLDWFDQYKHLVISNGPFFLARYDPPAQFAELDAFRDPNYPFTPADLYKGAPQLIEFAATEADSIVLGEPYEATVTLEGPGTLGVRYLFSDAATGAIIAQGEAEATGDNEFTVNLDGDQTLELDIGLYQLSLAAYSDQLAQMSERRIEVEADLQ